MAYGARLESVLGASPRGFESPSLRQILYYASLTKARRLSLSISVTIKPMLIAFFSWWYGNGWQRVVRSLRPRIRTVAENFSVRQLLSTLFAPWKRITTAPGRSLEDRMHAAVDNGFSRVVGFVVRLGVLVGAFVSIAIVAVLTILEMVIWPLLPIAIPGCIIAGFIR